MTTTASVALLSAALSIGGQAAAQDLVPSPPLAPDIDALPRLKGNTPVVAQINALLDQRDARDLEALNCSYETPSDQPGRLVEVLADGPKFLSFVIAMGTYCEGAAHPWSAQSIVNFDLDTGKATDLQEFLPQTFTLEAEPDNPLAALFIDAVVDPPEDCLQAYSLAMRDGYLGFELGLVESNGAMMILPQGLAYVDTPCLDAAYVPVDRLREAGFGDKLIEALTPPN